MDLEGLKSKLKQFNQEHLLDLWDIISEEERKLLYNDLSSINYGEVTAFFDQCKLDMKTVEKLDDNMSPIPKELLGSIVRTDETLLKKYQYSGLDKISKSQVAVLLLAGGQGTRLGVSYPKGMYDVGLPSKKTLYQLQAERILKTQELAANVNGKEGNIPWYIMTSDYTKEATENFFEKHNHFGIDKNNITLFEQDMLPCFTFDGKIILEKPHKVARAPDGNGGLYRALYKGKILDDMINRGIKYIHVYCVDNILVKMADPTFLGFCIEKNACCGAKVVEKTHPTEAVGVVCKVGDIYQVVEYSEISLKTAELRDDQGRLAFNAGNICNHFFSTEFLKKVCENHESELKHHVAKKKIPFVDDKGNIIKPTQPNGIKMEKFVFDVFKFARNSSFAVWEVLREEEFSPLKNGIDAPKDNATTSRHSIFNLHKCWVLKAGGTFVNDDGTVLPDLERKVCCHNGFTNGSHNDDEKPVVCEISPLISLDGEALECYVKDKKLTPPLIIEKPEKN